MKDLLSFIVTNIVNNPDAVAIDEQTSEQGISLLLTVDPADMGIVIGKGGQTIKAIRKLLAVRAMAENVRVNLQLIDPEQEQAPQPE